MHDCPCGYNHSKPITKWAHSPVIIISGGEPFRTKYCCHCCYKISEDKEQHTKNCQYIKEKNLKEK